MPACRIGRKLHEVTKDGRSSICVMQADVQRNIFPFRTPSCLSPSSMETPSLLAARSETALWKVLATSNVGPMDLVSRQTLDIWGILEQCYHCDVSVSSSCNIRGMLNLVSLCGRLSEVPFCLIRMKWKCIFCGSIFILNDSISKDLYTPKAQINVQLSSTNQTST